MFHRDCTTCHAQRREVVGGIVALALILGIMFGLG